MPTPRRLWDSCTIIDYLAGSPEVAETCSQIIEQAERGGLSIFVSAMARTEVAYLEGMDDQDSKRKIREFFGRGYIIPVAVDMRVASVASDLVIKHRSGPKIKPPDAVHLATAIQLGIPVVETTDEGLVRFDGLEGITIRLPLYEGTGRLPGLN